MSFMKRLVEDEINRTGTQLLYVTNCKKITRSYFVEIMLRLVLSRPLYILNLAPISLILLVLSSVT